MFWSMASLDVWVRVRFTEPVEGPDPYASPRTTDDHHEFKCQWLRPTGNETLFGTGNTVGQRWLPERIERIEWRVDAAVTRQGGHKGLTLTDRRLAAGASRLGTP